jgi:hypothetical protein
MRHELCVENAKQGREVEGKRSAATCHEYLPDERNMGAGPTQTQCALPVFAKVVPMMRGKDMEADIGGVY